jgi:hypothetical protein
MFAQPSSPAIVPSQRSWRRKAGGPDAEAYKVSVSLYQRVRNSPHVSPYRTAAEKARLGRIEGFPLIRANEEMVKMAVRGTTRIIECRVDCL